MGDKQAPNPATDDLLLHHNNQDDKSGPSCTLVRRKAMPSGDPKNDIIWNDKNGGRPWTLSWRIFPPPTADPRRAKKKKKKKKRQQNNQQTPPAIESKAPESSTHSSTKTRKDGGGDGPQNDVTQKGKELWRHKQQQYQYTYPYKVGETIRMLVPQKKKKEQRNSARDEECPKTKKQKLSSDECNVAESDVKSSSSNSNNQLMPGFARVDKIVQNENDGATWLHVTRLTDQTPVVLSPKEQRKLLCPELAMEQGTSLSPVQKTCTVVLVEETLPFRHVARLHLDNLSGDRVLEIGCSTGELSKLVWRNHSECSNSTDQTKASSWIGMDHSQEMIDRCQEQLNQHISEHLGQPYAAKIVKVDALEEPKRAAKEATTPSEVFGPSPTVVLIDIGGNRECGPVVKTMAWVFEAFGSSQELRMVIVKSRALVRQLRADSETSGSDNGDDTNETIPGLDASTGIVSRGTEWFASTHKRLVMAKKNRFEQRFKHPLKAPKVVSPVDGSTPICRYHNYHKDGCKLYNDRETLGTVCPLDHDYCHSCLQKGHVAKNCPNRDTQSCY